MQYENRLKYGSQKRKVVAASLIALLFVNSVVTHTAYSQQLASSSTATMSQSQITPTPGRIVRVNSEQEKELLLSTDFKPSQSNFATNIQTALTINEPKTKYVSPSQIIRTAPLFVPSIQNLKDLEKFMKKNFTYRSDNSLFNQDEFWQTAEEMLQGKVGDCEDFAIFARAILDQMGYETFLFSVYWNTNAHTVVVFKTTEGWGYFNLAKLKLVKVDSVAELAGKIHGGWEYAALMRQSGRQGVISRKFQGEIAERAKLNSLLKK